MPDNVLETITRLKLAKVAKRLKLEHGGELVWDDDVVDEIVSRCREVESGARNVDNIVTNSLLPRIGRRVLDWMIDDDLPERVDVKLAQSGVFLVLRDGEEPGEPLWDGDAEESEAQADAPDGTDAETPDSGATVEGEGA